MATEQATVDFGLVRIPQLKAVESAVDRWLRFDQTNKRGLVIKANTYIYKSNGEIASFTEDTKIDLTSQLGQAGKDYFLYINDDGTFTASTNGALTTGKKIGRFHTLCVGAGTMTMIAPAPPSSGLNTSSFFLVKGYDSVKDPDLYAFYRKAVQAVTVQTQYDVVTVQHPLSGFAAGDILPESVFCTSFCPLTLYEDGMVYDVDTDSMIDIYLQSGAGHSTRSAYNVTHRVSRSPWNHQEDMRAVGKTLLKDNQFTSAALGSNERTNITGSSDKGAVGGHADTNGRRMISAIGAEEMCGYLWQWLDELGPNGGSKWEENVDGHDSFGQNYGIPYLLLAGGAWANSACCGSRSRSAYSGRSAVDADLGGRGSSRVKRWA